MADIDIERKKKSPLPWILGLLALALLAFLLMQSCGDEEEVEPAVVTDTTTAVTAPVVAPVVPPVTDTTTVGATGAAGAAGAAGWIGAVLAGTSAGQSASGSGTVPETPSDRGFWIEDNGQRVFAVLAEPMEQLKDINPGQRVTISNARVLPGSEVSQVPQDVDADTRRIAEGQQYFLFVPSTAVQITAS